MLFRTNIVRRLLGVCLGLICCGQATTAAAASFNDIQYAIIESRWEDARQTAKALDGLDPAGEFLGLYVEAAYLMQSGRCDEASAIARTLIGVRPDFAPAQELVWLCSAQTADLSTAQSELEALLAIMPEGPQRTILEQMHLAHRAEDGPQFSAYVEAKPSTNTNRQTAATNVGPWVIAPESRGQGGAELTGGVSVAQQLYQSSSFDVLGVLKADLSWDSVRQLVRPQISAELPVRVGAIDGLVLSATPFVTFGFDGSDHALTRAGLRGAATAQLSDTWILGWSGSVQRSHYPRANWRSNWELDNNVSVSFLLDEQTRITTNLGLQQHFNDDETRNFQTLSASLRLDHMMDFGLIVGLQGKVGVRNYASAPAPTIGTHQQDNFVSGRAELSHRDLTIGPVFGSAIRPVLFYEYTRQSSNNVFYDYDSHDVGLTMRVAF